MKALIFSLAVALAFLVSTARAAEEINPQTELRVQHLAEKLRCLVCQNQSLADSHAELALDLRNQIRAQIRSGRSDEQITGYMVERYGDFVLYEPPFKATTALLWVGPFVLLAAAIGVLIAVLRRRRAAAEEAALAPLERRLVERVLGAEIAGDSESGSARRTP